MTFGFLVGLHCDLKTMTTTQLTTPSSVAVNVATSTVMSGIGGGVVAAVLGGEVPRDYIIITTQSDLVPSFESIQNG